MIADQAARGHVRHDPGLAGAGLLHLHQLALAGAGDLLDHGAGIGVVDVDRDLLHRLQPLAVPLPEQDLRAGDRELEPLAAHVLDQDAHLQLAASRDLEGLAARRVGDLDGDVRLRLAHQALSDHAGLHLLAVAARERAVVDAEGHGDRGRVDRLGRQGHVDRRVADRVGHGRLRHAGEGDDVAGDGLVDRLLAEAAEGEDLRHAERLDPLSLAAERLDLIAGAQRAALDPPRQEPADERIGAERRGEHAERLTGGGGLPGGGDVRDDELEQRVEALARAIQLGVGPAGAAGGVEHGEVELIVVGAERGEEVEHLVERAVGLGVGLVDLVQHHDGPQPEGQRLGGDELRLRHRPLGRVDEQHDAVHHRQDPLHLAAEVGVAGRVHDVDSRAPPLDRGALGEDGDAPLALEVVRVHRPLGDSLILAVAARLLQQLVDQRGLAMVDMGDDGDVSQVHDRHLGSGRRSACVGMPRR